MSVQPLLFADAVASGYSCEHEYKQQPHKSCLRTQLEQQADEDGEDEQLKDEQRRQDVSSLRQHSPSLPYPCALQGMGTSRIGLLGIFGHRPA